MKTNRYAAPLAPCAMPPEADFVIAPHRLVVRAAVIDACVQAFALSAGYYFDRILPYRSRIGYAMLALECAGLFAHALALSFTGRSIGGWLTETRLCRDDGRHLGHVRDVLLRGLQPFIVAVVLVRSVFSRWPMFPFGNVNMMTFAVWVLPSFRCLAIRQFPIARTGHTTNRDSRCQGGCHHLISR